VIGFVRRAATAENPKKESLGRKSPIKRTFGTYDLDKKYDPLQQSGKNTTAPSLLRSNKLHFKNLKK